MNQAPKLPDPAAREAAAQTQLAEARHPELAPIKVQAGGVR